MIKPSVAKINTYVFYGTLKRFEFMHGKNEICWQTMLIDAKTLKINELKGIKFSKEN